jgi:hypothetical protein
MARVHSKRHVVFVSHSGQDDWIAKQIAKAIEATGAEVFLDALEIEFGTDFEEEILASLKRANELVVLMTPWAMQRPYVWAELGAAWGRRLPIVVLLHGMSPAEFQSRPEVPVFIKRRNLLDLNSVESYFRELQNRVATHE